MTAPLPPRPTNVALRTAIKALEDTYYDPYEPDTPAREGNVAEVARWLDAVATAPPGAPERPPQSPAVESRYRKTVWLDDGTVHVWESSQVAAFDRWADQLQSDRDAPGIDRVELHDAQLSWGTDLAPQILRLFDRRTGAGCTRCGAADSSTWHRPRCLNPDPPAERGLG